MFSLPVKVHLKPRESNLWAYFSWCDHDYVLRCIGNDHLGVRPRGRLTYSQESIFH